MTAFSLKMIALTSMLIDHFAHVFGGRLVELALVPVMRAVGRLAFPIFVYFIGEGFRRTSDVKKYLMRLGVFALISEIPFDLAINNARTYPAQPIVWLEFSSQNIFFTLFLGLLAAYIHNLGSRDNSSRLLLLLPLPFVLGHIMQVDYGVIGVALVFFCSIVECRWHRLGVVLVGGLAVYLPLGGSFAVMLIIGHIFALALLSLYNGVQGPRLKWLFYTFYPLHLLALFGLLVLYESLV